MYVFVVVSTDMYVGRTVAVYENKEDAVTHYETVISEWEEDGGKDVHGAVNEFLDFTIDSIDEGLIRAASLGNEGHIAVVMKKVQ